MQDQTPTTPVPVAQPSKIIDVVGQTTTSAPQSAAPLDPELMSEPAVEPAPQEDAEASTTQVAQPPAEQQAVPVQQQPQVAKRPSTVPIGAIIIAIIVFVALAAVALVAYSRGS